VKLTIQPHLGHSFKYNQQDATLYNIFLLLSTLYMFQAVSPPIIRSSKTVHTASSICQACLLLPLVWVSYYCQCSTCFRRLIPHCQELKNCTHSIGYCQACLLLPLAWVSSPTLAVAASKLDIYPMVCVQFLSS